MRADNSVAPGGGVHARATGEPLDPTPTPRARRRRLARGLFLAAAGVSFVLSVSLWFLADREQGLFVGLWVPSILSLGTLMTCGTEGRDE